MAQTFEETLDQIRGLAGSEREKGATFERLMARYLEEDPVYGERFGRVRLWGDWARATGLSSAADQGIDLVAERRDGGLAAIQCKFHAPGARLQRKAMDSFLAFSAGHGSDGGPLYAERIVIDTGAEWGKNLKRIAVEATPQVTRLPMDPAHTSAFAWPDLTKERPEALAYEGSRHALRPDQKTALDKVVAGFSGHDRGKLVMACGTGKTLVALHVAEAVAGRGGRVLYLVPSISLLAQSMREWAGQKGLPHRYVGICSDATAGRNDDVDLTELEIPVTTDGARIAEALGADAGDRMTVAFSTYQSLELVARAHERGAPAFDLAICDEAHRTTGVERGGDAGTAFRLVHDARRVLAAKRLYMTATPRVYGSAAKATASAAGAAIYTMDDEEVYGPEFHRLSFGAAVSQGLLTDYRVAVLAVHESFFEHDLGRYVRKRAEAESGLSLNEAAKMIGCWRALENPETLALDAPDRPRVGRILAFANTIKYSKLLSEHWPELVRTHIEQLSETQQEHVRPADCRHVDGAMDSKTRSERLDWLRADVRERSRILCNVRCLAEGVDVPALDGIVFMSPRSSEIDIIQAVGRAMRKSDEKNYGYIVLPVAIPPEKEPEVALDRHEGFNVVWKVLRALRSHDERLDAEINKIDLNERTPERIAVIDARHAVGEGGDEAAGGPREDQFKLSLPDIPPEKIYAKIVEKCGDRAYWETWGGDVANIYRTIAHRARELENRDRHPELAAALERFRKELEASTGFAVTGDAAVDLIAQHVVVKPVLDALFDDDASFAERNPVSRALDEIKAYFDRHGLEAETKDLAPFYESVRQRARVDNPEARQQVLVELFDSFFKHALPETVRQLGIVYTPVELVDFVLRSTDEILRKEFGRGLTDKDVDILDPFTGTGTFIVRLLQSGLIRPEDRERKFERELHATEILLLAYYIAAVNIERARQGGPSEGRTYAPFPGILWGDTFRLGYEGRRIFPELMGDNTERAERQRKRPIRVIVGNPPWSAGNDIKPMERYREAARRIRETYAARSTATLRNSLYDTYKMAIRYASDRIIGSTATGQANTGTAAGEGVIAFVTNGGWLDGNADGGMRAVLAEEFDAIHVVDLRGNARLSGEASRREGEKIFGSGSRARVTLVFLVRRRGAGKRKAEIRYRDIGEYLKREEKFRILEKAGTLGNLDGWTVIEPNAKHDWINQRSGDYGELVALGRERGMPESETAIFGLHTNGQATGRDGQVYNFSASRCEENGRAMARAYRRGLRILTENPESSDENLVIDGREELHWNSELIKKAKSESHIPPPPGKRRGRRATIPALGADAGLDGSTIHP